MKDGSGNIKRQQKYKQYQKLNNELRRITGKNTRNLVEECDELEEMHRQGCHDQVYQKIKQLSTKKWQKNNSHSG